MSNFICSECGMTNIDCGGKGYKTPKEIELEKKVHILNEANMKLENELGHFADLSKEVKELEERLADADKTLKFYDSKDFHYEVDGVVMGAEPAHKYFVKWGVKMKDGAERVGRNTQAKLIDGMSMAKQGRLDTPLNDR